MITRFQIFEKFTDYTDSNILNIILNSITEHKKNEYKCKLDHRYFDEKNKNYWLVVVFAAKNYTEKIKFLDEFENSLNKKILKISTFPEVENVEMAKGIGRYMPFHPNSKYGTRCKANETAYEINIYLTDKALKDIKLEIEMKANVRKYNL